MSARVSELVMKVAEFRRGDPVSNMFYLHGFASSPQSSKSSFLSARLAQHGVTLQCPDLNEPDFSTLTVTRMIEQVEAMLVQLRPQPVAVFGSSLGAFVALHLVERLAHQEALDRVQVRQLILLAPALEFGTSRTGVGDDLLHWKEKPVCGRILPQKDYENKLPIVILWPDIPDTGIPFVELYYNERLVKHGHRNKKWILFTL